jgi:transcriptional regulator
VYLPSPFANSDLKKTLAVMRKHPFATVISVDASEQPFISHLPMVVEHVDGELICYGHLARANAHWRLLSGGSTTIVFHGPNTYITPKWYVENGVPTWNYVVIHVQGQVTLIEDRAGIVKCLEKLTALVERGPEPWPLWIPDNLAGSLERSIVGFRLHVEKLDAKFKLSQNRSAADRAGVVAGLSERLEDASLAVRDLMKPGA